MRLRWFVAFVIAYPIAANSYDYKRLSGDPSEFDQHEIPSPVELAKDGAHRSQTFTFDDSGRWYGSIVVDSSSTFSIGLVIADDGYDVELTDPKGRFVDLPRYFHESRVPIGDSSTTANASMWTIKSPNQGTYSILIQETASVLRSIRGSHRRGYLVVWNDSRNRIFSHVTALSAKVGSMIGIAAKMISSADPALTRYYHRVNRTVILPAATSACNVQRALLVILRPDGNTSNVKMFDDGLHGDGAPGDGVFGGEVLAETQGEYSLTAVLHGVDNTGTPFERSASHTTMVSITPFVLVTDHATEITYPGSDRLTIRLLTMNESVTSWITTYRPYFEFWGRDEKTGADVPITFATGLANIHFSAVGHNYFDLEVDANWIARAGAKAPFELRGVYVQEIDVLVIVAKADRAIPVRLLTYKDVDRAGINPTDVAVAAAGKAAVAAAVERTRIANPRLEVTKAMLQGIPQPRQRKITTDKSPNAKLVLVHGFCADENPFEVQSEDWTDAVFFKAYNKTTKEGKRSMTNDEFARKVIDYTEKLELDSFALVAQSQGGMASLHILNYYHTGLDIRQQPGRKIQSVATPYRGNTALTEFKKYLDIIGIDCNGPFDLSVEGAALWLTGIGQANIIETNIYRTQYNPNPASSTGGWCIAIMNLILQTPNDGVCEVQYSAPPTDQKAFKVDPGECHGDGMEWPASFWDRTRNHEMNNAAGR